MVSLNPEVIGESIKVSQQLRSVGRQPQGHVLTGRKLMDAQLVYVLWAIIILKVISDWVRGFKDRGTNCMCGR